MVGGSEEELLEATLRNSKSWWWPLPARPYRLQGRFSRVIARQHAMARYAMSPSVQYCSPPLQAFELSCVAQVHPATTIISTIDPARPLPNCRLGPEALAVENAPLLKSSIGQLHPQPTDESSETFVQLWKCADSVVRQRVPLETRRGSRVEYAYRQAVCRVHPQQQYQGYVAQRFVQFPGDCGSRVSYAPHYNGIHSVCSLLYPCPVSRILRSPLSPLPLLSTLLAAAPAFSVHRLALTPLPVLSQVPTAKISGSRS